MRSMSVSQFKAQCLRVFDEIQRGGEPVVVTKRGVPIAQVGQVAGAAHAWGELGRLATRARIEGDVMEPVLEPEEWEALG